MDGSVHEVGGDEVVLVLQEMKTGIVLQPTGVYLELIIAGGNVGAGVMVELGWRVSDVLRTPAECA